MKKLNFLFYSGEELVYDFKTEYNIDGEYVCFSHDGYDYKIKKQGCIEFIRSSSEDELLIKEGSRGYVTLKEIDKTFEMKMKSFDAKIEASEWIIRYELESDEGILKTIKVVFE